ncbi:Neuroblastoma suppressor of tumorigenicity 1 [Camponotus floridanus]|uniref:Neuroblastoma suppressor of tumorigenicity 1 n=1 Tax=Camponotus floridanus TaxID=104421 RepID=E2ADC3_CAMFO|nr:Neuroblastoma suppressor of tumorigenicity 1 [Camponotus floridanus]
MEAKKEVGRRSSVPPTRTQRREEKVAQQQRALDFWLRPSQGRIMGTIRRLSTMMLLLMMHSAQLDAHREHKVHNIVLYPDKHSWCKTTPIKQVVAWPQCSSQELDNNVCVGACFSYMVPHSEPSAPGDLIRPYCDSCQPLDSVWHTVTLDCKDEQNNPVTMQKKVQIITNCSCSSCMETSKIKPDYNTLLQSLTEENLDKNVNVAHETPDLLLDPNLNASKNTTRDGTQTNERFLQLFKKLKESQKLDESGLKEFSKFEEEDIDLEKFRELFKKTGAYYHASAVTCTGTMSKMLDTNYRMFSVLRSPEEGEEFKRII